MVRLEKNIESLTDLELVNKYCLECRNFVNPLLFRHINERGLYNVVNGLPYEFPQRKSVAYARMAKLGKVFGDSEIDEIAGKIQRLESLRTELNALKITDTHEIAKMLEDMKILCNEINNYFR